VWNVERGLELHTLRGHSDYVSGVAVTEDGRLAFSASADRTLKVWDVADGRDLGTLKGHSDNVYGVAVNSEGRRAASASYDKTVKVWAVETGSELATFWVKAPLLCCAVSSDERTLVAGDRNGVIHVLQLE
jgi:WD40 repeat protein